MNNEFLLQLSPEDQTVSDVLQSSAQSIQVNPHFQSSLEARLKGAHPGNNQPEKRGLHIKIIPAIGWAILAIGAFLILNWALRALVPNHQPAAGKTAIPTVATEQAAIPNVVSAATPVPTGAEYDWRGTKLYLNAILPDAPEQASVFLAQPEQPATLDSVRALAEQFGMSGNMYETPSEIGNSDTPNFLVVDGNQRLQVRSNCTFRTIPITPVG